jgi:hypothetical protein
MLCWRAILSSQAKIKLKIQWYMCSQFYSDWRASAVLDRHVFPALVQKGFKELQRVFGLGADRN